MKKIICILLCLIIIAFSLINAAAEEKIIYFKNDSGEIESEVTDGASCGGNPNFSDINSISITFYIVNGKAYASYSVSTRTDCIDIIIKLQKQQFEFLWSDINDAITDHSNKKYITGSYSTAVNDSGTYRILLEIKVNGETYKTEALFEYDKNKVYGDAVADGVIRANDARLILRYSAKLEKFTEKQKNLCDIDNNGIISAADARIALRISAKLI